MRDDVQPTRERRVLVTSAHHLSCACGQLQLAVDGRPIITSECHCTSCRTAGSRLQALPSSPRVLEENGGTHFVLYRKDRVRFLAGTEHLRELRLSPKSPTRRVVATCCHTPIFLEFQNGHWLSLYGRLWPEDVRPPISLRTMTSDLPPGTALPDDVPNARTQNAAFFAKLLGAWIAMGFRRPKITGVNGALDA